MIPIAGLRLRRRRTERLREVARRRDGLRRLPRHERLAAALRLADLRRRVGFARRLRRTTRRLADARRRRVGFLRLRERYAFLAAALRADFLRARVRAPFLPAARRFAETVFLRGLARRVAALRRFGAALRRRLILAMGLRFLGLRVAADLRRTGLRLRLARRRPLAGLTYMIIKIPLQW